LRSYAHYSEITENNKSRKIKEFKSNAETALWLVESYGLVPQYLQLESTDYDPKTAKVDFNPSSSKSAYQDLPEEERQQIHHLNSFIFLDLLFSVISENSFPLFAVPTFL
jgi:serine protease inhibitor